MDFLPSKQRYLNRAHLSDRFSRLGKLSAMALKTRNLPTIDHVRAAPVLATVAAILVRMRSGSCAAGGK